MVESERAIYEELMTQYIEDPKKKEWAYEFAYNRLSFLHVYEVALPASVPKSLVNNELAEYFLFLQWVKTNNLPSTNRCNKVVFAYALHKFVGYMRDFANLRGNRGRNGNITALEDDVSDLSTTVLQMLAELEKTKEIINRLELEVQSLKSPDFKKSESSEPNIVSKNKIVFQPPTAGHFNVSPERTMANVDFTQNRKTLAVSKSWPSSSPPPIQYNHVVENSIAVCLLNQNTNDREILQEVSIPDVSKSTEFPPLTSSGTTRE